ncbi:MAG: hypothetical protein JWM87_1472 [Candidatus Eremiobacteraeota bacterium]|nr:hypothetical protein [Candidatus Eremiobacteraeota bacterium]
MAWLKRGGQDVNVGERARGRKTIVTALQSVLGGNKATS